MAEYFDDQSSAEEFIHKWGQSGKRPVYYLRIKNHGSVKWLVSYDASPNPKSSPHIKVLKDLSTEIGKVMSTPWSERQKQLEGAAEGTQQRWWMFW